MGSGIVTRRPLVLQLINRPNAKGEVGGIAAHQPNGLGSPTTPSRQTVSAAASTNNGPNGEPEEWGEFLHLPGKKFTNFEEIREEIVRETDLKVGKTANVSPQPINLRIYSPNVLTLTMVDLPGLTKVPVGDQPKDIEKQIRDMLLKYISKNNAIILAVTAANTDLANSDGLKLAREVDPDGLRTIGVLTKIDLMDQGTDVVDILAGRVIPLRLGYVPVVNRGQRDIDNKKKITAALEAEKNYFENHPAYRTKAQYCGTPYLARKLNIILMHHIKNTLPEIKAKINQTLVKYTQELQQIGDPLGSDDANQSNIILNIITEFCSEYRATLEGTSNDISSDELSGGARIGFVFHEVFGSAIRSMDPFDQIKDVDIRTILYNSSGSSPALFVGTAAFEVLIKQQIKRLEDPSIKVINMVYDELVRILNKLLQKPVFKRFPSMREKFYNVVIGFFKKAAVPTTKLVTDLIASEACYINTGHPDFLSGHKATVIVTERLNQKNQPMLPVMGQDKNAKNGSPALPPRDPQMDLLNQGKDDPSFFGSFFKQKKKPGVLEAPPAVLKASGNLSEREYMETEVIKLLLTSYYNIVKRTVADVVPKAIMLNLVMYSKDELQRELLSELYKKEAFDEALKESEFTVQRRKECKKMIEALTKADEIIAGVSSASVKASSSFHSKTSTVNHNTSTLSKPRLPWPTVHPVASKPLTLQSAIANASTNSSTPSSMFASRMASTTATASTESTPSEDVGSATAEPQTHRIVGYWYLFCAFLVFGIVALGGLTRLTESGLSITEWNLIKGMKFPTSKEEWETEFGKYKQFPEYKLLNHNITMNEFKFIFFMEWAHRMVGRFIGLSFIIPGVYFAYKGYMSPAIMKRSLLVAALIGSQGVLGWYMVKSGLRQELMEAKSFHGVSQYWLAAHLGSAFVIYSIMLLSGFEILGSRAALAASQTLKTFSAQPLFPTFRRLTKGTAALIFLTALSGAFVAGLDAGLIYNEFPYMGDGFVPSDFWAYCEPTPNMQREPVPFWRNLLENPAAVQFDHRLLAFTTTLAVCATWGLSRRIRLPPQARKATNGLVHALTLQVTLGITTLLYFVPVPLAAAHQSGSLLLLSAALWLVQALRFIPK
ncbi:vacuolar protein sorting-associated protein 1 [Chytridiales sp. JEL 0842]|nr:vacuolar protein sorting-associated protein 1 [Chytridiales sp. JEL 0842]